MFTFRKSVALALTSVVAVSTVMSASAQSTGKTLSSNFTLVNLQEGNNTGTISYVRPNGSVWRDPENISLTGVGDQIIRYQYFDEDLPEGSGSVVVSTDGPVGAVVQIQARAPQAPSFGAYIGVSEGAAEANVPLVMRNLATQSGTGNSQVIVQNASEDAINVAIDFVPGAPGLATATKNISGLAPNAAVEVDLNNDPDVAGTLGDGWYGSAVVRSTTPGGAVAVVSNLFNGADTLQTFNAFTEFKTRWGVPLFASRLANTLSTPVSVQNASGSSIPAGAVTLSCIKDSTSTGTPNTFSATNPDPIAPGASYFFNPVVNMALPENWFGACTVDSGSTPTAVFVQLRIVQTGRAGAHEGIALDSSATTVVIPLYAKRLVNGFASAITIQNLSSSSPANVTLNYLAGEGKPANCTATTNHVIPAGGSLIQNMRVVDGVPNSVPQIADNCFGTLTVTSNQPVDAFVQLDLLDDILDPDPGGDPYQAHNAFTVAN